MKVLVISHPSISTQNNMGKTLVTLLSSFEKAELRQLYVQPMCPDVDLCQSYYRITDTDALRSVFGSKSKPVGKVLTYQENDEAKATESNGGWQRKAYSVGRKRTCGIYIARNMVWKLSRWYSEVLKDWLRDFRPDVIFFASGDYRFAYDITYRISCDLNIPIIMYCCDDYYLHPSNSGAFLSRYVHKNLMKGVRRCISRSVGIITICEEMAKAYRSLFDKPIYTVYTGSSTAGEADPDGRGIVYLGNVGLDRYRSLVDIGRALKRLDSDMRLEVYSGETDEKILGELTEENGIVFHGSVNSQEMNRIISDSRLVVHTESFTPEMIGRVRYSVSTKIADLLASGRCIFAYGPAEVASVRYLRDNDAACVVTDSAALEAALDEILNDREKRAMYIQNAKALAKKNHDGALVPEKVAEIIRAAHSEAHYENSPKGGEQRK